MLRVNNLIGFGARRGGGLVFLASAVSNAGTITIPAGAQAGDLAVLCDHARDSNDTPTDVVPSGWTGWGTDGTDAIGDAFRGRLSYKILGAAEGGTNVTGMNDSAEDKVMLVFRNSGPITNVTASTLNIQTTTGNPAAQSVMASSGTPPLVVIGCAAAHDATAAFSTANPAFDATVATADADMIVGYKIYNASPQNHSIDMNNLGANLLASGYLSVS